MPFIHFAEARAGATDLVRSHVAVAEDIAQALLVTDLFGRLRLVLWTNVGAFDVARTALHGNLAEVCGDWWTGDILLVADTDEGARIWNGAWLEARQDATEARLRHLSRHRSRTGWFAKRDAPLWEVPEGPPLVVFYSFKGGLGRSTTLASFAIQRSRAGERVAVVDFDLDAPGVGTLLSADQEGTISPWGVVDYFIERTHGDVPLSQYHHACARVSAPGEIKVFPAGMIDECYTDKLARVDLEEAATTDKSALVHLLADIRSEVAPNWILLDARTGLSEPAGRLLSGIAHLHVLFGTTSEQSWQGLRAVIDRLGRQRLLDGKAQAEILLVQAMAPATSESRQLATEAFAERARKEFVDHFYAVEPEGAEDDRWNVGDLESADAPHAPTVLAYQEALAHFRDVEAVADTLTKDAYLAVGERIAARFRQEEE
ncbi:MAG: KGGVGR-motif variant AAA ATPase [Acidimicrobiales bacterium]